MSADTCPCLADSGFDQDRLNLGRSVKLIWAGRSCFEQYLQTSWKVTVFAPRHRRAGHARIDPPKSSPTEAEFTRDYPAPEFTPNWSKPQINRMMVQDFILYCHMDLEMTKMLLDKEPLLINSVMDWGAGDWESGLGGASHMGRRDIVELLLERGARIDIFCATMMGQVEAVKAFLTLQPKLIDSRGPHGFNLHFHGQLAGERADEMVQYLQSVKKVELRPNPFVKK